MSFVPKHVYALVQKDGFFKGNQVVAVYDSQTTAISNCKPGQEIQGPIPYISQPSQFHPRPEPYPQPQPQPLPDLLRPPQFPPIKRPEFDIRFPLSPQVMDRTNSR